MPRFCSQSIHTVYTPHNVGSVLWRLFSTLEVVQYIGGITSVLWGVLQYCGGCSVKWGIASVLWGIASVLWRWFSTVGDNISTVGDNISTVEGIQYCGGIPSVLWGDNSSTYGG